MKKIKLVLTIVMLFVLATAYSRKTEIVYMKIQQASSGMPGVDSYIHISYPDLALKAVKLAKAGFRMNETDEVANTKLIQQEINSLTELGYEMDACTQSGDMGIKSTLMIFSRKKDK